MSLKRQILSTNKNKENFQQNQKTNSSYSLVQLGLPCDTFDGIILVSDRKQFQKSVENLNRIFPTKSDNTVVNLKDIKKNMLRDLKTIEKKTFYTKVENLSKFDDDEVSAINSNSFNLDFSKKFRSSSALSSKIPTPVKPPSNNRCKSKMELRIERRMSHDIQRNTYMDNEEKAKFTHQRRNSIPKDVVQFEEFF